MTTATRPTTATSRWLQDFENHQDQHSNGALPDSATLGPHAPALAKSLAVFQVGESGEGTKLFAAARTAGLSSDQQRTLELFIDEEKEHARLLALILGQSDHPVREDHWTDKVFIWARQLFGFRGEILMLLVAELVANTYYPMLRNGVADQNIANIFARISADEKRHIDYHAETLPPLINDWAPWKRGLGRLIWNITVVGTSVVVAVDHRAALRICNMSIPAFIASILRDLRTLDKRLFGSDARW